MGKRSIAKKRGIQRGVAKHKIRSQPLTDKPTYTRRILGIEESVYFSLGKRCFDFWFFGSDKLYLTPFTKTGNGQYVPLDAKAKFGHYSAWFLMFLILVHQLGGVALIVLCDELKIETIICITLFLTHLMPFCFSFGTIFRPEETMDLLNSWSVILSCLKEVRGDVPSAFDDLSVALKLISGLLMTQLVAIIAALFSLAFSTLPTCYFPVMESVGLIPEGLLPRFAWQLLLLPLEYATALPAVLITALTGTIILIAVAVHRIFLSELRSVST